jgi:hypothetical protein
MADRARRIRLATAFALVAAVLATTAACTSLVQTSPPRILSPAPASVDFVVTHLDLSPNAHVSAGGERRPSHLTVQTRSSTSGATIRSQTARGDQVTAGGGGSLLTATAGTGCSATIRRVDPSGRTTTLATVPHAVGSMELSPDGRELAYASLQGCSQCGFFCPAGAFPDVLRILDLATRVEQEVLPGSGEYFFGYSWSPDGRQLVVQTSSTIGVVDATDPATPSRRVISARKGCAYYGPVWTTSGIAVGQHCGNDESIGNSLVLFRWDSTSGTATTLVAWEAPECSQGIEAVTDFRHESMLAIVQPGGSVSMCSASQGARLFTVAGARLRQIGDFGEATAVDAVG